MKHLGSIGLELINVIIFDQLKVPAAGPKKCAPKFVGSNFSRN